MIRTLIARVDLLLAAAAALADRRDYGKDLEYEALELETRYRLSEPGRWLGDPVLHVELRKTFVDDRPFSVEEELILSTDRDAALARMAPRARLSPEQEATLQHRLEAGASDAGAAR